MRDVMLKTQALGEAIVSSTPYRRKLEAEERLSADPEAAAVIAAYMEKRSCVEDAMSSEPIDPVRLAQAGQALEEAESVMNAHPLVMEAKKCDEAYHAMMENVNRLLRLIVEGEGDGGNGCTGSCETCSGCH
ncbi:MAG: YlbF family regulator [bacterium]|nr:YlbF family regulator [bacterium]